MVSGIGSTSGTQALFQQLQQLRAQEAFSKTDADSDGLLSLEEFKSGAPQGAQKSGQGPSLDDVFGSLDSDGDGSLTQDEFAAGAQRRPPQPQLSGGTSFALQELFAKTDSDSDGALSLDEFKAGAPDGADEAALEALFTEADADADGILSETEFTETLAKNGPPAGGPPPGGAGGPPPSGGAGGASSSSTADWLEEILNAEDEDEASIFDAFDTDDDGSVSETELAAGFEQVRTDMLNYLMSFQTGQTGQSGTQA